MNASRNEPLLIGRGYQLKFDDILGNAEVDIRGVQGGDIVALIGDFDSRSLATLLRLIDIGAIVVPLTAVTRPDHEYFFEAAAVDVVINEGAVRRLREVRHTHPLLDRLRQKRNPGTCAVFLRNNRPPKGHPARFHQFSE